MNFGFYLKKKLGYFREEILGKTRISNIEGSELFSHKTRWLMMNNDEQINLITSSMKVKFHSNKNLSLKSDANI